MFRVKESEEASGAARAEWVLLPALVLALLGGVLSVWFLLHDTSAPLPAAALLVSAVLLFCAAVIRRLQRRFSSSQRSLRQVKMLAHDILASMDRGIVTTDCAGGITSINSAGIQLLVVDFECVGRPLACISSEVPLGDVYRKVTEGRTAVRDLDYEVRRAGRSTRLRVDGHRLKDVAGTMLGCVIHLRDVTERILLEERMRRIERFLGLATLASGLHHEIKNPLTALSIHIQLLEEALANGSTGAAVDELVAVLKTEVCRLNGVLESFRSFANLQHLTLQPTDAVEVLEKAIRLIRPQAAQQGVRIVLLHPERALPEVPLDGEKFEQAILNLIINALEAMPAGGTLTISAAAADGELRVSVQDNGPGIPPEVQGHLFQPYFSTKSKGSGMGLALSEKLIGQHGGTIGFRTGPEGTAFDITIPLAQLARP